MYEPKAIAISINIEWGDENTPPHIVDFIFTPFGPSENPVLDAQQFLKDLSNDFPDMEHTIVANNKAQKVWNEFLDFRNTVLAGFKELLQ